MLWGGQPNDSRSDERDELCLIDYIENNEIESYEEFISVIYDLSPESVDLYDEMPNVSYFSIDIDYDNMVVAVTTISELSYGRAHGASNGASKTYYASNGLKIFSVTVEGTFKYDTGYCTTMSSSGSFSRALLSTWTSTPTISQGNITTKKAYARISGTATSGSSSISYTLTLTCDDSGNFSSY